jgi:hypothetical protein
MGVLRMAWADDYSKENKDLQPVGSQTAGKHSKIYARNDVECKGDSAFFKWDDLGVAPD